MKESGNVPIHGIGCGNLVFDKFELFPDYKEAVATTGIPFFQVIGNHHQQALFHSLPVERATLVIVK